MYRQSCDTPCRLSFPALTVLLFAICHEVRSHLWLQPVSCCFDMCLSVGALCSTVAAALQPQGLADLCKGRNLGVFSRWCLVGDSRMSQLACLGFVFTQHCKSVMTTTYDLVSLPLGSSCRSRGSFCRNRVSEMTRNVPFALVRSCKKAFQTAARKLET